MSVNNSESKTREYFNEANDLAKIQKEESEILSNLTKEVNAKADAYCMHQKEKGKKCTKKQAVEKILKGIGLGKIRTYLIGGYTAQQARKFVLDNYTNGQHSLD